MTYRNQLLAGLLVTAVVGNVAAVGVMYLSARHYVLQEFRAKVETVAASMASQIDGDLHETIRTRDDEQSEAYRRIRESLRKARDINRRADTYVTYIFTVRRAPQDPRVIQRVVDPEESLENAMHAGEVYHAERGKRMNFEQLEVDEGLSVSDRGTWLAANAPIRNREGRVVGAVVVEFGADRLHMRTRPVLYSGLLSGLIGCVLAAICALLLAGHIQRPLVLLRKALTRIGKGEFDAKVVILSPDEFAGFASALNEMADGLAERDKVKSAFGRYVSPEVMKTVLAAGPGMESKRTRITVMFCDIRGFSTISENLRPEEVVALLNGVFERMVAVITRYGGTLDKFLGDGMMVIFGAPKEDQFQEESAIRAALDMQKELVTLRETFSAEGRAEVRMGIGINSGVAVVGNIGASQRMEYTAIGDTVNLASRLQTQTSKEGVGIIISEYTYASVRGVYQTRPLGSVQVKGRQDPVQIYEVIA